MKALLVDEAEDDQGRLVSVRRVVDHRLIYAPAVLRCLLLAAAASLLALALLHISAQAVELQIVQISGNSSGQGLHSLEFAGDLLNVSILQGNSSSFWHINATAGGLT